MTSRISRACVKEVSYESDVGSRFGAGAKLPRLGEMVMKRC